MKKIKMGYCPTMAKYARVIDKNIEEIEPVECYSAAEVMELLRRVEIDSGLIGRTARNEERTEKIKELRLKNGITLIYKMRTGISLEQLKSVEVVTYLPEEKVLNVKDFFGKIIHLSSIEECLKYRLEVPVIIDWKDYRDEFRLLIPVTNNGKVPHFRAPVLYYADIEKEILNKIKETI